MIQGYPDPEQALSEHFAAPCRVVQRSAVGGGCINNAQLLVLDCGARVFLKENTGAAGLFRGEAVGLDALHRAPSGPRVPEPIALYEDAGRQWLAMEFIESGAPAPGFWEQFGAEMAELHRDTACERYGFQEDNHIGSTPQVNTWEDDWTRFFGEHRLRYQLELARRNGVADGSLLRAGERLIERLPELLPEPEHASLLHGDFWGGNFMVDLEGNAVIIDPAVYYGDAEADLAMARLFGGFDGRFYEAYHDVYPIAPGHAERVDLYNLYHVLNHLNLFGRGYLGQAQAIVARYI